MTDTLQLKQIVPDKDQPREFFDAKKQHQLKENIKQHGIMTPLIVQDMGSGKYLLVDGERRYRAAAELNLKSVPVIIDKASSVTERLVRQFSIQEMHESWTPIEKARALIRLSNEMGMSLNEACKLLNIDESMTRRYVAFSELRDQENFLRSEIPLDYVEGLKNLLNHARNISVKELKMEFNRSDEKKLERRIVAGMRNGLITRRSDVTKIKDAFTKEPKMIRKFMENAEMTPQGVYLEAKAEGANALRNATYNAMYLTGNVNRFLNNPDVKISMAQLEAFKDAELALKKIIALA